MRTMTVAMLVLAMMAMPVLAQDGGGNPPADPPKKAEPPPADPPVDPPVDPGEDPTAKLPNEEQVRLKLLEKDARDKADSLKKRIEAAKTDGERAAAIGELASGTNAVVHPITATALLPYLNPRQIRAGLIYGDATINAAIDGLKKQPFDETYYGVMKMVEANRTNLTYVMKLLPIFGEIRCKKAVAPLVEMMRDKRDGRIPQCKIAIQTLGKIGHRDAIDQMIKELEEQDKAGINDEKGKERRSQLNKEVLDALQKITAQNFKLGSDWRQWWIKNAETFQKEKKITPPDPGGDGK